MVWDRVSGERSRERAREQMGKGKGKSGNFTLAREIQLPGSLTVLAAMVVMVVVEVVLAVGYPFGRRGWVVRRRRERGERGGREASLTAAISPHHLWVLLAAVNPAHPLTLARCLDSGTLPVPRPEKVMGALNHGSGARLAGDWTEMGERGGSDTRAYTTPSAD